MLLDAREFAFTAAVEAGLATFARELASLSRCDFELWPDTGAYQGGWLTFALFLRSWPDSLGTSFAINHTKCPASTDLLRAHLGLEVPRGALMRVAADRHEWREGRCLLFDGFVEHETANTGSARRVVLLVDALVAGDELAGLHAWRSAHGVRC